jgi:hypothetical protein
MPSYIIRKKSTGEEKVVEAPTREAALASMIEHLFEVAEQTDLFGASTAIATSRPPLAEYVQGRWNDMVKRHPQIAGIRNLDASRRMSITTRAKPAVTPTRDGYAVWDEVLAAIEGSMFLTGRCPPREGSSKPFTLTIDFVCRPAQFLKILDGGYPNDRTGAEQPAFTHDPETGRRYSTTEQAARSFVNDRRNRSGQGDVPRGGLALR